METTMNYEKLTVERFAVRLKEGAYKGLTGARRAIGKTDWTKKDKDRAHAFADSHFAAGGKSSATAPKAAAKKASASKAAAKTTPPKTATKKTASKKSAKAAARAQVPVEKAQAKPQAVHRTPSVSVPSVTLGAVVPPGPPVLEEVTRQNSASAVIAAYRNSGELNTLEQRAYDIATVEYVENASKAAKRIVRTAAQGIPTPTPLDASASDESADAEEAGAFDNGGVVTAPSGAAPRILVPNGEGPVLTPEEQAQYERLQRGAAAVPAILGHG